MACFIVPMAEAVVTTAATVVMKAKEKKAMGEEHSVSCAQHTEFSRKMKWLPEMLWGGSALLAFEHFWHGEIVPFYPFLTAAENPADMMEMLHEMATVGVGMAGAVTVAWLGMVAFATVRERQSVQKGKLTVKGRM